MKIPAGFERQLSGLELPLARWNNLHGTALLRQPHTRATIAAYPTRRAALAPGARRRPHRDHRRHEPACTEADHALLPSAGAGPSARQGADLTFIEPANVEILLGGSSYSFDLEQSLRGRLLVAESIHPAGCQTPTPKTKSSRAAMTSPQDGRPPFAVHSAS